MSSLKQAIAEEIIDTIVNRTRSGDGVRIDEDGKARSVDWPAYSKNYKKSLTFKSAGKTNKVNLTLDGDMLDLMDIIQDTQETVTIGWDDDTERKKAYAHQVGKQGDSKVKVPRRPFFGVSNRELNEIVKKFEPEVKEAIKVRNTESEGALETFLERAINRVRGPGDGEN